MASPTKVRLNADISPDVADALKQLAKKQGVNLTEALSRAIGTEYTLANARGKGGRVLIKQGDETKELVFTGLVRQE
jgi:hypothetical protein